MLGRIEWNRRFWGNGLSNDSFDKQLNGGYRVTSDKTTANVLVRRVSSAGWVVVNALASSFFWSMLTLRFFLQGYNVREFYGGHPVSMSLVIGSFLALGILGFLGPRANEKNLFQLGCIVAVTSALINILDTLYVNALLHEVRGALSSGVCAIFVLAWYERISRTPRNKNTLFVVLNSLMTVLFVLIGLQMNYAELILYTTALLLLTAGIGLLTSGRYPVYEPDEKVSALPGYFIVILFIFGAMMSILSFLSIDFPAVIAANGDPNLIVWMGLVILVMLGLAVLLHKRLYATAVTVLVPVIVLSLLMPPFLSFGLEMIISALLVFIVVCESIVYSVAPSNAKKTFHIGRFDFTFWQRSWGVLGIDFGHAAMVIFFNVFDYQPSFNVVLWIFVANALLCLTMSMIFGRIGYKLPEGDRLMDPLKEACGSLRDEYGLTARETEVLELVAAGRSLPYVQEALHIAPSTAATHINHIYQKLGIHTRQELIDLVHEASFE